MTTTCGRFVGVLHPNRRYTLASFIQSLWRHAPQQGGTQGPLERLYREADDPCPLEYRQHPYCLLCLRWPEYQPLWRCDSRRRCSRRAAANRHASHGAGLRLARTNGSANAGANVNMPLQNVFVAHKGLSWLASVVHPHFAHHGIVLYLTNVPSLVLSFCSMYTIDVTCSEYCTT